MKIIKDNYNKIKEAKCLRCESILAVAKYDLKFDAELCEEYYTCPLCKTTNYIEW